MPPKGGGYHRWKNAFLTEQELYNLVTAHALVR